MIEGRLRVHRVRESVAHRRVEAQKTRDCGGTNLESDVPSTAGASNNMSSTKAFRAILPFMLGVESRWIGCVGTAKMRFRFGKGRPQKSGVKCALLLS